MSLTLVTQSQIDSTGQYILFQDVTGSTSPTSYGQGGNISSSSVTATRILVARYTKTVDVSTLTSGASFIAYNQYQKKAGSTSTIDTKSFSVGDTFIPRNGTFSVPSGDTWVSTGFISAPFATSWLPNGSTLSITLDNLGQSGSYVADDFYIFDYYVYYPSHSSTFSATSGASYLISGSGTATYNGQTFYAGESFTATDTTSITIAGGAIVHTQYAAITNYASLTYTLDQSFYALISQVAQNGVPVHTDMQMRIIWLRLIKESLQYMAYTQNVSFTQAGDWLVYLQKNIYALSQEAIIA